MDDIVPQAADTVARTSHEYIWDMLRWYSTNKQGNDEDNRALFKGELFGIDSALDRMVEYFKAASAGSDVGRRLLLLLGPPSGGKSTVVILLKRAMEE